MQALYNSIRLAFILVLSSPILTALADTREITAYLNHPISAAQIHQLSQHATWRAMLGFNANKSDITAKDFFLAGQGNVNPRAELEATLHAFALPAPENVNTHAQCKFRGRYTWLSSKLQLRALKIPKITCPDYLEFSNHNNISSLSLIFASGYLGNPASYYGHLLIKLNKSENANVLTDKAINYGASFPANENMLVYIIKGITGGYKSKYSKQQFYYHLHNYNDGEFRDLWEYELNLPDANKYLLIAHIWELLNAENTYYFFNRNCAYRFAKLLQVATEEPLTFSYLPWETPQAIMQRAANAKLNSEPLVKKINYIPSRQSKLYQRHTALNYNEKKQAAKIVKNFENLNSSSFYKLADSSKIRVLDTLIDYYKFAGAEKTDAEVHLQNDYRNVLSKRFTLPTKQEWQNFSSLNKPHLGHKPSYVNLSYNHHNVFGDGATLRLRPAYYDALDSEFGQTKNSALSMADLTIAFMDNKAFIKQFHVVKIESVGRNITRLPGDNTYSWGLQLGAEQLNLDCTDCLAHSSYAKIGYSHPLAGELLSFSAQIGGGYIGKNWSDDNLYIDALTRIHANLKNDSRLQVNLTHREFVNTAKKEDILSLTYRLQIGSSKDLRFSYKKNRRHESSVSIGHYW